MASAPCPGAVGFSAERQHHDLRRRRARRARARECRRIRRGGFEQPVDVGLGHDQRRGVAVHELREARFAIAARQHERDARGL